ncbi:MAG: hypothetical protein KKD28_06995 [Chloroflexi bacterium]|nr:hypothetical protein [Chloroflexota bacterium]
MNDKTQAEFIPFHAINEFMRSDYRLMVIRNALLALPKLDRGLSAPIDQLTKKLVRVPGFRNSVKAPASVKAVAMVKPFEQSPKLVAAILSAWAESRSELRQQIYDILTAREWKILPLEADRTKLPGFLTRWPAEDDFEVLYTAYTEAHPDGEASIDDMSLMVVWLAGRLPIDKVSKDEIPEPEAPEEESET